MKANCKMIRTFKNTAWLEVPLTEQILNNLINTE